MYIKATLEVELAALLSPVTLYALLIVVLYYEASSTCTYILLFQVLCRIRAARRPFIVCGSGAVACLVILPPCRLELEGRR